MCFECCWRANEKYSDVIPDGSSAAPLRFTRKFFAKTLADRSEVGRVESETAWEDPGAHSTLYRTQESAELPREHDDRVRTPPSESTSLRGRPTLRIVFSITTTQTSWSNDGRICANTVVFYPRAGSTIPLRRMNIVREDDTSERDYREEIDAREVTGEVRTTSTS